MSELSGEDVSASEIRNRLKCEPFLIQRLGIAAINLNYIDEFNFLIEQGRSPIEIYNAILQELHNQGLPEPAQWLELFGIPNLYD